MDPIKRLASLLVCVAVPFTVEPPRLFRMFFDRCQAINYSLPQTQADSPDAFIFINSPRLHHPRHPIPGSVTTTAACSLPFHSSLYLDPPSPLSGASTTPQHQQSFNPVSSPVPYLGSYPCSHLITLTLTRISPVTTTTATTSTTISTTYPRQPSF